MGGHHHHLEGKRLYWAVLLNALITLAQIVGGLLSGSLALLSDALHNFSDVMSLLLSYAAHRLAHKKASPGRSFGYKRAEILAALFNASVLAAVSLYLIVESVHRLLAPEPVAAVWVMALALLGVVVNALSVVLLHLDARHNLNIRSAYLHLLADMMTSIAVFAGGAAIYWFGWYWIDPLLSILIACYLIYASAGIVSQAYAMLMQFAPASVEVDDVRASVEALEGIERLYHVHLWQLSDHELFLEARLVFSEDVRLSETRQTLEALRTMLHAEFGITHTTFQTEFRGGSDDDCCC